MVVSVVVLVTVTTLAQISSGFNLDLNGARVLLGQNETNFGYSVALWSDLDGIKRLVIGAPKWRNNSREVTAPTLGQIQVCEPASNQCHGLPSSSKFDHINFDATFGEINKKQGMGFPESLHTSLADSSLLVACAPRYSSGMTVKGIDEGSFHYNLYCRGACYFLRSLNSSFERIVFFGRKLRSRTEVNDHRFTGNSLTGFSVTLSQDQTLLYAGGPNAFLGQGVVGRANISAPSSADKVTQNKIIDKALNFTYEGWAIALGRFSGQEEILAVSTPNAGSLTGKVSFYSLDLTLLPTPPLEGEDMGAKFGFCLTVGDLDGDGAADLVVGAPLAPSTGTQGKTYIFYAPNRKSPPPRETLILTSGLGRDEGYFGSALTSADLDQDGFYDVVVGEPGGTGAIYVFSGGRNGLSPRPTQKIVASHLPGSLLGFGFSLASGTDMDNNGYPDLLVGVPQVSKAVFIRSAPVLVLTGHIRFDPPIISLANKSCEVEGKQVVCFDLVLNMSYHSQHPLGPYELTIELELDHEEGRASFYNANTSIYTVKKTLNPSWESFELWNISAYIKPGRPYLGTPLEVTVRARLPEEVESKDAIHSSRPPEEGSVVPPIMAPVSLSASALLMCPKNLICLPRTDLHISVSGTSPVNIGEGDVKLQVSIQAQNNSAYHVHLSISYPVHLTFKQVSGDYFIPKCVDAESQVEGGDHHDLLCLFTSQLPQSTLVNLTLRFTYNTTSLLQFLVLDDASSPDLTSPNPDSSNTTMAELITPDFTSPDLVSLGLASPSPSSSGLISPDLTSSDTTSPNLSSPDLLSPSFISPNLTFHLSVASDLSDLNPVNNQQNLALPLCSLVNLLLVGQSQPNTVEGKLNESASLPDLTKESTLISPSFLGPLITHVFSLTNLGPSPLLHAMLHVHLPLHLLDGLPLLYLVAAPRTHGNLTCSLLTLNPNKFKFSMFKSKGVTEEGQEVEDAKEEAITDENDGRQHNTSLLNASATASTSTPNAAALKLFDVEFGVTRQVGRTPTADCSRVPCEIMTCEVAGLEVGDVASVEVSGYVVLASLKQVSGRKGLVEIRSKGIVEIEGQGFQQLVHPDSTSIDTATTQVALSGKLTRFTFGSLWELPWWCWLMVALVSLFILLILDIALNKLGFFKRKETWLKRQPLSQGGTYRDKREYIDEGDEEERKSL